MFPNQGCGHKEKNSPIIRKKVRGVAKLKEEKPGKAVAGTGDPNGSRNSKARWNRLNPMLTIKCVVLCRVENIQPSRPENNSQTKPESRNDDCFLHCNANRHRG